jgi:hypothetical protein
MPFCAERYELVRLPGSPVRGSDSVAAGTPNLFTSLRLRWFLP